MTEPLKHWFAREILVHEASLVRYLTRCWPKKDEIHDLRQEIYIRVYEAAAKTRPTAPKSFLFQSARNLMTDRVRRNRVVSIEAVGDFEFLNVLIDELSPERRLDARQELKRLVQAFDHLPPKCREIVWLRRVDELSQKEVAQRLGLSERTVESQIRKGMRLLASTFFGSAEPHESKDPDTENETEHGQQHTD